MTSGHYEGLLWDPYLICKQLFYFVYGTRARAKIVQRWYTVPFSFCASLLCVLETFLNCSVY